MERKMSKWLVMWWPLLFCGVAFAYDIPKLCQQNMDDEFQADNVYLLISNGLLRSGTSKEIADWVIHHTGRWDIGPWLMQDLSWPNLVQAAILVQKSNAENLIIRQGSRESVEQLLTKASAKPTIYSSTALEKANEVYQSLMSQTIVYGIAQLKQYSAFFCLPFFDLNCANALSDIADMMSSRQYNGVAVSMPDVMKRLLMDPDLVQGAARFAVEVLRKAGDAEAGKPVKGHLFYDLVQAYIETGSTPDEAVDRAWVIAAFYGTRGASIARMDGLFGDENYPLFVSMEMAFSAFGVLDQATLKSGHPYSYPSEVDTGCGYAKPYHFWMPAYLAHRLRLEGHNPDTAELAAHLADKIYEFGSGTWGRDPNYIYTAPFFDPYSVMIQIDLAYTDVGAFWGAHYPESIGSVGTDKGLDDILKGAKPMPELTQQQILDGLNDPYTKYSWFNRLINPDRFIGSLLWVVPRSY